MRQFDPYNDAFDAALLERGFIRPGKYDRRPTPTYLIVHPEHKRLYEELAVFDLEPDVIKHTL